MAQSNYPDEVLEQQEAVRASGEINMLDKAGVRDVALKMGFTELADYVRDADASEYLEMAQASAEEHRP